MLCSSYVHTVVEQGSIAKIVRKQELFYLHGLGYKGLIPTINPTYCEVVPEVGNEF